MTVALYEDEVFEAVGYADYYLQNEDFQKVVSEAEARREFVSNFGEGICVGPLGTKTASGYVDEDLKIELPHDNLRRGDLSYYEKL